MKAKILKTVLPIIAFFMAVGLAFATNNITPKEDLLSQGYIRQGNVCVSTPKFCDEVNNFPCRYMGEDLFKSTDNGTTCPIQLFHSVNN
jgi:hypothetical protein